MDGAPPPVPEEPPDRDWSLLPLDALSSVFVRLGAFEVLMGAGLVCRSWLQAAKLPDVWRVVDMENHAVLLWQCNAILHALAMAKVAVDRSDGQLRVFVGTKHVTNVLLEHIVQRSPALTTLRLLSCYDVCSKRLVNVTKQYPLLELQFLEIDSVELTLGELTAVLENCPVLEVLRLRNCFRIMVDEERDLRAKFARIKTMTFECDDEFPFDSDFEWDDYDFDHVPDFEDERTDDGSL